MNLSFVDGLEDFLNTLADFNEVFNDFLFLDQFLDFLGIGNNTFNVGETGGGTVESERVKLVDELNINVASVEERVEGFNSSVDSIQSGVDGDGGNLNLFSGSIDFMSESGSSSEASFEIDINLG